MKIINILQISLISALTLCSTETFAGSSNSNAVDALAKDAANLINDTASIVQDTAISASINTKLGLNKNLSHYDIDVSTNGGIVTLVGKVNSENEVSSVIEIAASTTGVKSVDASKLTAIKSDHPLDDIEITSKIKGTFIREKLFGDKDIAAMTITVDTKNGVVYLSGMADNPTQAQNAVKIAQSIAGVTRVESSIAVVKK